MKIDMNNWMVTPRHSRNDFTLPLDIEQKITIFLERTDGWQLSIAERIINGVTDKKGETIDPSQSAYAVLHIVFSFFEMIAKYQDGYVGRESRPYFVKGVESVFPETGRHPELLDLLYSDVRCGLYHCGYTDPRVFIVTDLEGAIGLTRQRRLLINPRILVQKLREYLISYVEKLRNIDNAQLRQNFEKRFNFDSALI